MRRFIVEPAVAVKWFVPEAHSDSSSRLLDGGSELLAPETMPGDFGRIITFKVRSGQCSVEEGALMLEALGSAPLSLHPIKGLLDPACRIACAMGRPLGDGLNLTLAVAADCRVVTASRSFHEALRDTPFAAHVKWVGDIC